MGKIVLGLGVPHAPQLVTAPERWPDIYDLVTCASKKSLRQKEVQNESLEDNAKQLESAKKSFEEMRKTVHDSKLDAIIALTDDHFDNFFLDDYPQFSVYLGSKVDGATVWLEGHKFEYKCDETLERAILNRSLHAGFDLSFSEEVHLEYGHVIPLSYILPDASVPIVPFFTNAYANPQPTPKRCYDLGKFLSEVVRDQTPSNYKVGFLASGGMSHYPGEPLGGEVDVKFDSMMMNWIRAGRAEEFSKLSSDDIDKSGNTEMRSWIAVLGALGNGNRPAHTNYVLSWRAIIGLGFAMWRA